MLYMRKTKLVKKINHTHGDVKTNGEAKNGLIRQKRERKKELLQGQGRINKDQ